MVLTTNWHLILALGFCLAFLLLPWIARYPQTLQLRSAFFIASQCAIFLFFLATPAPEYIYLLAFLVLLPLLALSEQMRFLCQPSQNDKKRMLYYQLSISGIALLCLLLPNTMAFMVAASTYLLSSAILFTTLYPKDVLERVHIRGLSLCIFLMTVAYSVSLTVTKFQISNLLINVMMTALILSTIIANLWAQNQYLLFINQPTKKNTAQALNAENEEHKQSLITLSHDMRTPLSGILGMAELLLDTPLSPAQRDYTQTIQASGNSLLHLINDRLDSHHNAEKNMTILEEVFDVTELVHYCLDIFKNRADDKGIELISYIDTALPKELLGDAVRLRQILCRFIHNALRFTERGEIVISLKSLIFNQELGIQFSVQDTGLGLTEGQVKLLFKNIDNIDQSDAWHIGPNIATCAQLIEQMGGLLHVDSTPYEGALFSFTLPLKTPSSLLSDSTTEFIASFAGKRLLVVDDNRTVTKVLAEQANQWGMRVSTAENGTEALAVARNAANLGQSFDVIIMDYQMPGMSGLQLGARLKEDALITNDVILIMLTGLRQNNIQNLARNAGIHRVLSKPITSKQLRQVISQELKRLQGIAAPVPNQTGHLGKIKVLIAEDNQLSQKVIRGMMQKLGIEHTIVSNGREAVHSVMQGGFDVVLMDCDMPIMDGYSATQEIRRWEKQEHREAMPIFALTAHILEDQKQKAFNSGMNKHLSKPIELGDLQNALLETITV
ncbi:MAG TPA: response regulator [Agitococcus sp.]|jgi:CheY-like chemotaxis protein/signal transduction histidine kinase|nr:response regulator [Moraxellaceae bacterium]MBK9187082.1 response regulator [Moraxellaceae bacterium]MBL0231889.1 response regulator [Moraxellaceae bacterium]MCC6374991.1 response regulator [Moraxellaceae bacterium]HQV79719.1 response regulator [Agitococcus sp.]